MSISAWALGEAAIAAQTSARLPKRPVKRPPASRQIVAKGDQVPLPEPR